MTVKCKSCGASYDRKYNVCPSCGSVRLSLPLWSRIAAIIAGTFLLVTFIMLPLGVFNFTEKESPEDDTVQNGDPSETPSEKPEDSDSPGIPPVKGESELTLSVKCIFNPSFRDEFSMGVGLQVPLKLEVSPARLEELKPEWKSSDEELFTVQVDENDPFSVNVVSHAAGKGTLTVSYGNAAPVEIKVIVDPESNQGNEISSQTASAPPSKNPGAGTVSTAPPKPTPTPTPSPSPSPSESLPPSEELPTSATDIETPTPNPEKTV